MYDIIRIIDPISKSHMIIKNNQIKKIKGTCYDFWKRSVSCNNCISMKAYTKKNTFVKIEYYGNKVIFVTAAPIFIDESMYVIEMIKDISENGRIFDNNHDFNVCTMKEKIIMDGMTGVYNRTYIDEKLPADVNNSIINGSQLSLIIIHIENFKDVNDKYGYVVGVKIIKDFAKLISNSIRKNSDWVGMYDSDEILIVLNNTNKGNAFKVSENIKNLLKDMPFQYNDINIKITSNFGLYSLEENKIIIEEILTEVDMELYETNRQISKDFIKMNDNSLLILNSKIDKIKDILNEMCLSSDEIIEDKQKIKISQYLDGLIVAYMKNTYSNKLPFNIKDTNS